MTEPLVSVVLPVYNGEAFLEEAIRSVTSQSLGDIEVVVVDDGSTDGTAEILARVADPRVRVLSQSNGGIATALNVGLSAARGPYIARMDADDRSAPQRLARQVDFLDRHPEVAAVGSSYRLIDESGASLGVFGTLIGYRELRRDLFVRCPFGHGTMMIRAQALRELGGYDAKRVPAEDYDLWARLMSRHEIANLPEVLYDYRVYGQGDPRTQQDRGAELRDELWAAGDPPALSPARAISDLLAYRRVDPEVRTSLLAAYLREHRSLFLEALRRRRWHCAFRLWPALAVLAIYGSVWLMAPTARNASLRGTRPETRATRVLVIGHDASRSGAALQLLHVLERWGSVQALQLLVVLRRAGPLLSRYERAAPVIVLMPTWARPLRAATAGLRRAGPAAAADSAAALPSAFPAAHGPEWPGIAKKWLSDNMALAMSRTVRSFDPDVVFANTATHGDVVARLPGVPLVTYVHEQEVFLQQITLPRHLDRLLRGSACIVAASESVRDDLVTHHAVPTARIRVIRPFAPPTEPVATEAARERLRRECVVPAEARVVGACGALTWNKAPDEFIALAAAVARQQTDDVYFVWLGADPTGDMRPQLEALARSMGIEERVRFLPPRESTASFFAALDVFTLVSRTDSFPVVVLEAARQAVPTVCFRTSGGASEFVRDDAGIVVPTRDVVAIADAVISLLRDDPLRRRLGGVAQAREADHSVEAVSGELLTIVNGAAGDRGAAP